MCLTGFLISKSNHRSLSRQLSVSGNQKRFAFDEKTPQAAFERILRFREKENTTKKKKQAHEEFKSQWV
jgi:hypothetical protein